MPVMKLPSRNVRLGLGLVVITILAVAAHIAVTAILGARASYPQQPILNAAMPFLERGSDPAVLLPGRPVDVNSGGTWITVTDSRGSILASSALEDLMPVSLASCREQTIAPANCFFVPNGKLQSHITIELPSGSRQAVLAQAWHSANGEGYVFVGRSRERTDAKLVLLMQLITATWLAGLGAFWFVNRSMKV
jgi:hypothetical protein